MVECKCEDNGKCDSKLAVTAALHTGNQCCCSSSDSSAAGQPLLPHTTRLQALTTPAETPTTGHSLHATSSIQSTTTPADLTSISDTTVCGGVRRGSGGIGGCSDDGGLVDRGAYGGCSDILDKPSSVYISQVKEPSCVEQIKSSTESSEATATLTGTKDANTIFYSRCGLSCSSLTNHAENTVKPEISNPTGNSCAHDQNNISRGIVHTNLTTNSRSDDNLNSLSTEASSNICDSSNRCKDIQELTSNVNDYSTFNPESTPLQINSTSETDPYDMSLNTSNIVAEIVASDSDASSLSSIVITSANASRTALGETTSIATLSSATTPLISVPSSSIVTSALSSVSSHVETSNVSSTDLATDSTIITSLADSSLNTFTNFLSVGTLSTSSASTTSTSANSFSISTANTSSSATSLSTSSVSASSLPTSSGNNSVSTTTSTTTSSSTSSAANPLSSTMSDTTSSSSAGDTTGQRQPPATNAHGIRAGVATRPDPTNLNQLRERMFHTLFLRASIAYARSTTPLMRRMLEFMLLAKVNTF